MKKRIAIQGFSGSFHEQAARDFYPEEEVECMVECATFDEEYQRLASGEADALVMAIENTVSGGLLPNLELLRKYDYKIKGEVFLRIGQNLMALPGQQIGDIREVRTHYMAINQTREFFRKYPHIRLVESEDTAKSAADIAEQQLMGVGAVASGLAAQIHGLDILAAGIETYKQNYTRFLILDDSIQVPEEKINKASLCFTLEHTTGSLAHVLTILSFYGMNLTKIQSLPIPGHEWQYFFYADIKFESYKMYQLVLNAIRPLIEDLNILGEYEAHI